MQIAILFLIFAVVCLIAVVFKLKRRIDRDEIDRWAKTWADYYKTDDAHWASMRARREKSEHEQAHAQAHADHQVTRQRVDALYEHFKLQPVVTTPEAPKVVCVTKT